MNTTLAPKVDNEVGFTQQTCTLKVGNRQTVRADEQIKGRCSKQVRQTGTKAPTLHTDADIQTKTAAKLPFVLLLYTGANEEVTVQAANRLSVRLTDGGKW